MSAGTGFCLENPDCLTQQSILDRKIDREKKKRLRESWIKGREGGGEKDHHNSSVSASLPGNA